MWEDEYSIPVKGPRHTNLTPKKKKRKKRINKSNKK